MHCHPASGRSGSLVPNGYDIRRWPPIHFTLDVLPISSRAVAAATFAAARASRPLNQILYGLEPSSRTYSATVGIVDLYGNTNVTIVKSPERDDVDRSRTCSGAP